MDLSTFYNQFREETAENVRVLSDGLLAIEGQADEQARRAEIDRIFRAAHTIKGSARMLGFEAVARLAHEIESVLGELRQGRRVPDSDLAGRLLRGGDALLELSAAAVEGRAAAVDVDAVIALFGGAPQPAPGETPQQDVSTLPDVTLTPEEFPTPKAPAPRGVGPRTVRVRVDRLDRMLNLAGELMIGQQVLANHADQLTALRQLARRHERAVEELEEELNRLRFSASQRHTINQRIVAVKGVAGQIQGLTQRQAEHFGRHIGQSDMLVRDLEQEVMAARLIPISSIYAGLPRTVRDIAEATGKSVKIQLRGETVELDRKVLELLQDPLLHLVRNAVDHGIEPLAERAAGGKPEAGSVEISAEAIGGEVRVTISDDGRGIDPAKLRDRAVRMGLLRAEDAARLPDHEALDLIFLPGFSTAPMVTDISGRGVGLDVVRSNINELSGHVLVESQPSHGTQIVLTLPLTLVTTRVLLVRLGQTSFALPASGCQGTIWIHQNRLRSIEGQPTVSHDGRDIVVRPMADLIGVAPDKNRRNEDRMPAVLVGSPQRVVALLVDALLDEREAVVKPLGPLLARQRSYSGAIQLGDGSLVLLLNPLTIIQTASAPHQTSTGAAPVPRRRPRLLVCDDSFTTRELIRSILQSAGYEVMAAVDGADALDKLRAEAYDLVVSDVEMPQVDGFQLTARIRSELALHELPVVLITSLSSDDHRRRGLEAGAQAYIVKSQFNQGSLLEVIQQLLGPEP
ncbi:hybrid sensor histidine kinase/response regulator [Chloroflexales bacterium ZM16-3]|nr:hybrid sensor histidine kinase/response regulator [Chloroflexales bacterium ZM16-3]